MWSSLSMITTYIEALSNYNKALQQRNALLKMEEEPDITLLELWEQQMASNGELLYRKRQAFVDELVPLFQQIYQQISGDKEQVRLHYVSHCQRGPLLDVIQRDRFKDRAVGYSLHGVHRDDLEFLLGDYPMKQRGKSGTEQDFCDCPETGSIYFPAAHEFQYTSFAPLR